MIDPNYYLLVSDFTPEHRSARPRLAHVLHLYKTGQLQVPDGEEWALAAYGDSGHVAVHHTSGVPTLKIWGRHKHHQWLRANRHPLLEMSRRALIHLWLTDERFWSPEIEIGLFGRQLYSI